VKLFAATVLAALAAAGSALAMGADPWTNAQTGLTYPLYKPLTALGLKQGKIKLLPCGGGHDDWFAVSYGAGAGAKQRGFDLYEGNPICSDIGDVRLMATRTIGGARVQIHVGCDPAGPCKLSQGRTLGYVLTWKHVAPAKGVFRAKRTSLEIVSSRLTLAQVLRVAASLRRLQ
jgi:hypothetical protein